MGTKFGDQKNFGLISFIINNVKEWKDNINIKKTTKIKIRWGTGGFILGIITSLIADYIFNIIQ